MKIIAEKKKILKQCKDVSAVFDKIQDASRNVDKIKDKADETHRKIQQKAEDSQKHHEDLIEFSKELRDLKTKEEDFL